MSSMCLAKACGRRGTLGGSHLAENHRKKRNIKETRRQQKNSLHQQLIAKSALTCLLAFWTCHGRDTSGPILQRPCRHITFAYPSECHVPARLHL